MPPLPMPPAPRQDTGAPGLPFARAESERALALDVPRYFIEVKVPGYSVERTVARARRRQQQQALRPGLGAGD